MSVLGPKEAKIVATLKVHEDPKMRETGARLKRLGRAWKAEELRNLLREMLAEPKALTCKA